MTNMTDKLIVEKFLIESNAIEREYSQEAFDDALEAWRFVSGLDIVTPSDVLKAHSILMWRLNPEIAGKYRYVGVRVGAWVAPNADLVPRLVENWCGQVNDIFNADAFINEAGICIEAHVDFEKIHPFEDGNGRIGRILYNWQRLKFGLPIHVILEKEKDAYYKLFKEKDEQ